MVVMTIHSVTLYYHHSNTVLIAVIIFICLVIIFYLNRMAFTLITWCLDQLNSGCACDWVSLVEFGVMNSSVCDIFTGLNSCIYMNKDFKNLLQWGAEGLLSSHFVSSNSKVVKCG